jgi:hypothetical protein
MGTRKCQASNVDETASKHPKTDSNKTIQEEPMDTGVGQSNRKGKKGTKGKGNW